MIQLQGYITMLSSFDGLMLSIIFVLMISLFASIHQRKQQKLQLLVMKSLQRDLRALANAAVGVGERVLEVERQQRTKENAVVKAVKKMPTLGEIQSVNNQPYEKAINMVQSGASIDDIVYICGLSQSEAELVSMMHRLDKVS